MADATWLALNVVSGGGSFSSSQPIGVTKIAKSVIAPLADQNISVFMLSTYQTDFILVIAAAGRQGHPPQTLSAKFYGPHSLTSSGRGQGDVGLMSQMLLRPGWALGLCPTSPTACLLCGPCLV